MNQGVCRFCGQVFMTNIESDDQDVLDQQAAMQCSCDEAKKFQTFVKRCENAERDAKMIFNEPEEEFMLNVILGSIEAVAKHKVDSVTIKRGKVTGSIKLDKDRQFDIKKLTKVERSNR